MSANPDFGVPWSASEDATVREHYVALGAEETAARLPGRTVRAVWARARRLDVYYKRPWTAEEDALLAQLWGLYSTRSIAKRLGRGWKAVYMRAAVAGLVARERSGTETLAAASERCGYSPRDMLRILRRAGVLQQSVSRNAGGYRLKPSYQLDPFEVDEAVADYVRGSALTAAARARGMSDDRLRRALEKIGVTRPEVLKKGEQWRIDDATVDRAVQAAAA